MIRRDGISTLREMAEKKVDEAATQLGQAIATLKAAKEKLGQLDEYRLEYQRKLQATSATGIDPITMSNFRAFMARLDTALFNQQRDVSQCEAAVQAAQQQLGEEQSRAKSFAVISERRAESHHRIEQRREQKRVDEHAARIYASSANSKE